MEKLEKNEQIEKLIEKENRQAEEEESNPETRGTIEYTVFDLESNIEKENITLTFNSLMTEVGNLEYKLPHYQRKYIWKKSQIEALVFSLLMDYPIPPIYVYVDPETKEKYILDGQQRVFSLYLYYTNNIMSFNKLIDFNRIFPSVEKFKKNISDLTDEEFAKVNGFHLLEYIKKSEYKNILKNQKFYVQSEVENKKYNITYKDLSREIKMTLNKKTLNIVTVKTKIDKDKKNYNRIEYNRIFNLLNNGGTPLKPQEIRNAIYSSDFYRMLHELNENEIWREIYGPKHLHNRDVETLLKCCALYKFVEKDNNNKFKFKEVYVGNRKQNVYKGSNPDFLNYASEEFRELKKNEIEEYRIKLLEFFNKFSNEKCKYPTLLLESLFIVSQNKNLQINKELRDEIVIDTNYREIVEKASATRKKIEERLGVVYEKCERLFK